MAQDNLRLMSVRIDEDTYQKISDLADRHPFWKKNYIIRQILYAVVHDFNDGDIYDMLRKSRYKQGKVKCEYIYPYDGEDAKQ